MQIALDEAKIAEEHGDVPVGAVVVRGGEVIARAHNTREADGLPTAHAELKAMELAAKTIGSWRLSGCVLYVTMEPCLMCAGAAVNSRIDAVVYGCRDAKAGAMGSVLNVTSYPLNHKPLTVPDVLADECAAVLAEFFRQRRNERE